MLSQTTHQRFESDAQFNSLLQFGEDLFAQTFEQGHALLQAGAEVDLASHR